MKRPADCMAGLVNFFRGFFLYSIGLNRWHINNVAECCGQKIRKDLFERFCFFSAGTGTTGFPILICCQRNSQCFRCPCRCFAGQSSCLTDYQHRQFGRFTNFVFFLLRGILWLRHLFRFGEVLKVKSKVFLRHILRRTKTRKRSGRRLGNDT